MDKDIQKELDKRFSENKIVTDHLNDLLTKQELEISELRNKIDEKIEVSKKEIVSSIVKILDGKLDELFIKIAKQKTPGDPELAHLFC